VTAGRWRSAYLVEAGLTMQAKLLTDRGPLSLIYSQRTLIAEKQINRTRALIDMPVYALVSFSKCSRASVCSSLSYCASLIVVLTVAYRVNYYD